MSDNIRLKPLATRVEELHFDEAQRLMLEQNAGPLVLKLLHDIASLVGMLEREQHARAQAEAMPKVRVVDEDAPTGS